MGNSKSDSNSHKSNSDSSSNSGFNRREQMVCLNENKNTIINKVWIVKKTITLNNRHIKGYTGPLFFKILCNKYTSNTLMGPPVDLIKPKKNVFEIKNESKSHFKHWALILELSNGSYVNIQFGRNGFSLKEFNKTDVDGENVLNSIIETWGEEDHPFSFCYLGNANYKYEKLKEILEKIKEKEKRDNYANGAVYYNLGFSNCQHFACDIEKILFGQIQTWHSFPYYLEQFYAHFFPKINIDKLKAKYI